MRFDCPHNFYDDWHCSRCAAECERDHPFVDLEDGPLCHRCAKGVWWLLATPTHESDHWEHAPDRQTAEERAEPQRVGVLAGATLHVHEFPSVPGAVWYRPATP